VICEFLSGSEFFATAIVEESFDSRGFEHVVNLLRLFENFLGFSDRGEKNLKWSDGFWPQNSAIVVMNFDDRCESATESDAVAAHVKRLGFAVVVDEFGALHFFGVVVAELKNVADFDAGFFDEFSVFFGLRAVKRHRDVGFEIAFEVAIWIDSDVVAIFFIRSAVKIFYGSEREIADDFAFFFESDGANKSGFGADGADFVLGGGAEGVDAGGFFYFALVDIEVAADHGEDEFAVFVGKHDIFHLLPEREFVEFYAVFHRVSAGGVDFLEWDFWVGEVFFVGFESGDIFVGGVFSVFGNKKSPFADRGFDLKFVAIFPADVAVVGEDFFGIESASSENFGVHFCHFFVLFFEIFLVAVEGVRVFHHEFADAEESATRAEFVAEFGGKLVDVEREVAVGEVHFSCEIDEHFLGGTTEGKFCTTAIFDLHQFESGGGGAVGFSPEFERVKRRSDHFLGAGGVHFFGDYFFDFFMNTPPKWQKIVPTGNGFCDESATDEKLMRNEIGAGLLSAKSFPEKFGIFHFLKFTSFQFTIFSMKF